MSNPNNGKTHGREELKKFFRNGGLPSEQHFNYLIDSMVNKEDDGFAKDESNGLHVSSCGTSGRLVTFYTGIDEMEPLFYIDRNSKELRGLQLHYAVTPENMPEEENCLFLQEGGKVGIGRQAGARFKLDVKGMTGMEGRMGTFRQQKSPVTVPADGKWYPILTELDGCQAFEVVARTGLKGSGRFSIMHAIALRAYGGPWTRTWGRIRKTCAHYGFFWNSLSLRWKGSTHHYSLELRSNSNFGPGAQIQYSIARLWDDEEVTHG
jgi:hypothetical protein